MFHFPGFAPAHLWIQCEVTGHYPCWVFPFGHPRINAWLATPRGFSQPPTSFIASNSLGIHRMLLVAWFTSISFRPEGFHQIEAKIQARFHGPGSRPAHKQGPSSYSALQIEIVLRMQLSKSNRPPGTG